MTNNLPVPHSKLSVPLLRPCVQSKQKLLYMGVFFQFLINRAERFAFVFIHCFFSCAETSIPVLKCGKLDSLTRHLLTILQTAFQLSRLATRVKGSISILVVREIGTWTKGCEKYRNVWSEKWEVLIFWPHFYLTVSQVTSSSSFQVICLTYERTVGSTLATLDHLGLLPCEHK